ncbi:MAG: hypothetical protein AAF202_03970 [Pseudomonadota bacterium]
MRIVFKKQDVENHEVRIIRPDGTEESRLCATRSFLIHDLTHLAFELEAKTSQGFWGSVASGSSLLQLSDPDYISGLDDASETMKIEKAVAIFQGLAKEKTKASLVEAYRSQQQNFAWADPKWFELEFISRVEGRLRDFLGRWKSTEYGSSMDLDWHVQI